MRRAAFLLVLLLGASPPAATAQLQHAPLGTCPLESGDLLRDCTLAYRTFGTLNADSSNAILMLTWFTGTSDGLRPYVAPEHIADSTRYFVILVDALGNGVSSSPSTSNTQPDADFPTVSIRDMVDTQHELVTKTLGLDHLHAVMGISMGGMQTFEWMTRYPGMIDRAVPMMGTTHMTPYDRLLWAAQLRTIEAAAPDTARMQQAMQAVARMQARNLQTPKKIADMEAAAFRDYLDGSLRHAARFNPYDWATQLRAMLAHNIATPFGGSFDAAADAVQADVLVVVGAHDHMVYPEPARQFAERLGAETLVLENTCGHLALGCAMNRVKTRVRAFLAGE